MNKGYEEASLQMKKSKWPIIKIERCSNLCHRHTHACADTYTHIHTQVPIFSCIRLAKIKMNKNIHCWLRWKKFYSQMILVEIWIATAFLKSNFLDSHLILKNIHIYLLFYCLFYILFNIYPRNKAPLHKDKYTKNIQCNIFQGGRDQMQQLWYS